MIYDSLLRQEVASWLASELGESWIVAPLYHRTHSITTQARASPSGKQVFLKLPLAATATLPDAAIDHRREFDALVAAAAIFENHAMFRVPRPIACNERGWLALEHVTGTRADIVVASLPTPDAKDALVGDIGRWMRILHDHFADPSLTYDFAAYRSRIASSSVETYPRFVRNALSALDDKLDALSTLRVPTSRIHGDLKIDNFMVAKDGALVGFDMQLVNVNPVIFDLASFLNRMDAWLTTPAGARLFTRRRNLEHAFLSGYAWTDNIRANSLSLKWLRLALAISTYDDLRIGAMATRGRLRKLTLQLRYAKIIRDCTKTLLAE